jgi:hypothetical protein
MEIDPFVTVEHDLEKNKLNIGVENRAERHQREMWGWLRSFLSTTDNAQAQREHIFKTIFSAYLTGTVRFLS